MNKQQIKEIAQNTLNKLAEKWPMGHGEFYKEYGEDFDYFFDYEYREMIAKIGYEKKDQIVLEDYKSPIPKRNN